MTITGVVRASGLSPDEKTKLGLHFSDYQLTDLNLPIKDAKTALGYFLETDNPELAKLLGQCVSFRGLPKNIQTTYERLAFQPLAIQNLYPYYCNPYKSTPLSGQPEGNKRTYQGTITHFPRPVPDVAFDYQLILEKPITEDYGASGSSQKTSQILIMPANNQIWQDLEKKIGNTTTLTGYKTTGLAQSHYLLVFSLGL